MIRIAKILPICFAFLFLFGNVRVSRSQTGVQMTPVPPRTLLASPLAERAVKDYGARGDGQVIFGSVTAGSPNVTLTTGTFTSTAVDAGKTFVLSGGGSFGSMTVTSNTGASPTVCLVNSTTGFQTGMECQVTTAGTSLAVGTYYFKVVDATHISLYSDTTTSTTPYAPGAGTGGTINVFYPWVTTISTVTDATHAVMSTNASVAVTALQGMYGHDDTTAIASAKSGGKCKLRFPAGIFMVNNNGASPGVNVNVSNITFEGSGTGNTIIAGIGWQSVVFQINGVGVTGGVLSHVTIKGMDFTCAAPATVRRGFAPSGLKVVGANASANTRCQYINLENLHVYGCNLGINLQGTWDAMVSRCWSENNLADGFSTYGIFTPCYRCSFVHCQAENDGDDLFSDNTTVGCAAISGGLSAVNQGILFDSCQGYNGGSRGCATLGSDGVCFLSCEIYGTYLAGGIVQSGPNSAGGFTAGKNVVFANCIFAGFGTATAGLSANAQCAGLLILSSDGTAISNVSVVNCTFMPLNGTSSKGNGIAAYCLTGGTGIITNLNVSWNRFLGPFAVVAGGNQQGPTTNSQSTLPAGAYFDDCTDVHFVGNQMTQSFADPVYFGANDLGSLILKDNILSTPNTNAGTAYGFNVNSVGSGTAGGLVITGNIINLNGNTLTNAVNLAAAGLVDYRIDGNLFGTLFTTYNMPAIGTDTASHGAGAVTGDTTTSGGLTWSLPTTTLPIAVPTALNYTGTTIVGSAGAATNIEVVNTTKRGLSVSYTIGTAGNLFAIMCYTTFSTNGAYLKVALSNGQTNYFQNGTSFGVIIAGSTVTAAVATDIVTVTVDDARNWLTVQLLHGGTTSILTQGPIPAALTGTGSGLEIDNNTSTVTNITWH
jgi:hypothetical protein